MQNYLNYIVLWVAQTPFINKIFKSRNVIYDYKITIKKQGIRFQLLPKGLKVTIVIAPIVIEDEFPINREEFLGFLNSYVLEVVKIFLAMP